MSGFIMKLRDGEEEMFFLCSAGNLVEEGGPLCTAELKKSFGYKPCDRLGVQAAGQCKAGLSYHRQCKGSLLQGSDDFVFTAQTVSAPGPGESLLFAQEGFMSYTRPWKRIDHIDRKMSHQTAKTSLYHAAPADLH